MRVLGGLILSILAFLYASPVFAAITQSSLAGAGSTSNATSYTTASQTPSANQLVIGVIANSGDDGAPPTLSGNNLTWVQIDTQTYDTADKRITMFRAMGASPTAGAVTITFGATNQAGCAWSFTQFDGVDTTGTNGSGAVGTPVKDSVTAATSITLNLTFSATTSGAVAGFALDDNVAMTPDTDWSEIHEIQVNDGADSMTDQTQWRATNDSTAVASWTGSLQGAGIAVEIKEPSVSGNTLYNGTLVGATIQ